MSGTPFYMLEKDWRKFLEYDMCIYIELFIKIYQTEKALTSSCTETIIRFTNKIKCMCNISDP